MEFAMLPPEVNSGRMYSGAGSGPILAAATAWDGLAADMESAASGYQGVISGLTGQWLGPSSISMAAAAAPYVAWMKATAAQAEQVASQARAAAMAYETAHAATVPPPVVAANRVQLAVLVATNLLGQNTVAIAATEAHYGEMWAQDATAMYGYAGSAAQASALSPFTAPKHNTNPGGAGQQAGAAAQTVGTSAAAQGQTIASSTSAIPQTLQGLGSSTTGLSGLAASPEMGVALTGLGADLFGSFIIDSAGSFGIDSAGSFGIDMIGVGELGAELGAPFGGLATPFASTIPISAATPVAASLGQAASVGSLSVPSAWTSAAPALRTAATSLPITMAPTAVTETVTTSAGTRLGDMALAGAAGRALAGSGGLGRRDRAGPAPRQRIQAPQRSSGNPVADIAAGIRELGELRDSGLITEEEFTQQKRRLFDR
jgi:PPE-repeat protein